MKHLLLPLFVAIIAVSCGQKTLNDNSKIEPLKPKEPTLMVDMMDIDTFTLYREVNKLFYAAKAVQTDTGNFDLYLYKVDTAVAESAVQTFVSVEQLTKPQLVGKKTELEKTYKWIPFKGNSVLFVQIQHEGFKDELELLDKRQDIESQLNKVIESENLGEWLASDVGPGGGNMLYKVSDVEKSLKTVLTVLKQNSMDNRVVIGRRVLIAEDDWFYEVIYPVKFTGNFNTM